MSNGSPDQNREEARKLYEQLRDRIHAAGLLEPVVIFEREDHYEILSGCLRYQMLLDLGIESPPCLVHEERPKIPKEQSNDG